MMVMRMIFATAMEVHVVRDFVTELYFPLTIMIYPDVNKAQEIQTPAVLVSNFEQHTQIRIG